MKLKELVSVVDRYNSLIEVRTGNEWYYDVVEEVPLISKASEDIYESANADREVYSVYAHESLRLVAYIE